VPTILAEVAEKAEMRETAIPDFVMHQAEFETRDGAVVHKATNLPVEKYIDDVLKKERPHYFAPQGDAVAELEALAFGDKPNLTAQGRYIREYGEVAAREAAKRWSTSLGTTKPGHPVSDTEDDKSKNKNHTNNPFHKSNWNLTRQGELLRTMPMDKVQGIARSVGSYIGATKPNPNF
jgi:hypothetical protein